MPDALRQRQLELEEAAIGLGLERARCMLSGERKPEDVAVFGGDKDVGSIRRRHGLLYTIATTEMPKLIKAIDEVREKNGTKSARLFSILEECGSDGEIAGVVIKTFFSSLFCGDLEDEEEDADHEGLSVASMADKVAEATINLRGEMKRESRKDTHGKKAACPKERETKAPVSEEERRKVGLTLTQLYLNSTKYFHTYKTPCRNQKNFQGPNVVEATEHVFAELLEESFIPGDDKVAQNTRLPTYLLDRNIISPAWSPMLVAPKPWTAMRNGGYIGRLAGSVSLVKGRSRIEGFSVISCPEAFEAVNHLQNTRYKVSLFVLEAFSTLLKNLSERIHLRRPEDSNRHFREMNCFEELLDVPRQRIEHYDSSEHTYPSRALRQRLIELSLLHSEAELLRNDAFYFVHYCDFRGRVYPVAGRFNYQAGDLPRSLIEFAEGKPIDSENAARWLAIHGANCYAEKIDGIGRDKAPFTERLAWVSENEKRIFALGHPSDNFWDLSAELEEWWLKAEKPWAFLAWAHEWAGYKSDPSGFLSHLPVEVDGSSNGYQHITALLRSQNLAEQVNMLPVERPRDIYTQITNEARKGIDGLGSSDGNLRILLERHWDLDKKKDHRTTDEEYQFQLVKKQLLALCLEGPLPRTVAKKIVMTYPYSATLYRMAKSLKCEYKLFRKWDDSDLRHAFTDSGFEKELIIRTERDLSRILPMALAEVIRMTIINTFPEAARLLDWFMDVGKKASIGRRAIHWTSPTGFVVHQDYEKKEPLPVSVLGKKFICKIGTGKSDNGKHRAALGPNFIHSCDAAHLMRTVNAASNAGIGYLRMVHDSYATHASDVEKLSRILREEFIGMYKDADWLTRLGESLHKQASVDFTVECPPVVGDFDISQVMNAEYFFA